jgi:predicted nucleic acid-binding protein
LILTYVCSGVLIYAGKGVTEAASLALPFLTDDNREYVTSEYVRLEVLPKPVCYKNDTEAAFYNSFFAVNTRVIPTSVALLDLAMEEACNLGLSAIDAINVACAVFGGAE